MAVFRHKTGALQKSIEIEQNRIAPRERTHQNTSRGAGPELANARHHGFAGAKIGGNGHFGPILADFGRFWRHENCDYLAANEPIKPILREKSWRHTRQVFPHRQLARYFLRAEKVHFYAEKDVFSHFCK